MVVLGASQSTLRRVHAVEMVGEISFVGEVERVRLLGEATSRGVDAGMQRRERERDAAGVQRRRRSLRLLVQAQRFNKVGDEHGLLFP